MSAYLNRALAAEFVGTGLLVAVTVGSGIMAVRLTGDTGLALMANTAATAALLVVLITIFAPLSGAHFNPVVTLVMALRRDLPRAHALPYAVAQLAGALAGVLLAHAMYDLPLFQVGTTVRSGQGQWIAEVVSGFGIVLTILGTLRAGGAVAATVPAYVLAANWFTASTNFANPTVTIARSLSDSFAGIRPADTPAFIAAQIAGGLLALWLAGFLWPKDR